jgi:hypothetical protein
MQKSLDKRTARGGLRVLAVAGMAVIASIGAASAQQAYSNQSRQYYGLYDQNGGAGTVYSRQDRADFDRSGTRGRMGLGASPYHPEGPGNAPD